MTRPSLRFRWVGLALLTVAAPAAAQQPAPGQIRPRPAEGREPEFPPPSIREYKPRSTLVVPVHLVPRAKFPAIDFHGHPGALTTPEIINRVGAAMDSLNIRVMVNASGSSGDRLKQQIAAAAPAIAPCTMPPSCMGVSLLPTRRRAISDARPTASSTVKPAAQIPVSKHLSTHSHNSHSWDA